MHLGLRQAPSALTLDTSWAARICAINSGNIGASPILLPVTSMACSQPCSPRREIVWLEPWFTEGATIPVSIHKSIQWYVCCS